MRVETRSIPISDTEWDNHVVLICESEQESHAIDLILGDCGNAPQAVSGEVTLSDGYGEHYIRLRRV